MKWNTPQSRIDNGSYRPAVSVETRKRAAKADPNKGCCLVTNCSSYCSVELCHIVPRSLGDEQLTALECNWGMQWRTLNLDTRYNLIHLEPGLHRLLDKRRWHLLPETSIILDFWDAGEKEPKKPEKFPVFEKLTLFKYTFIPLSIEMQWKGIHRQTNRKARPTGSSSYDVHTFPYANLEVLSHADPRFVIYQLGSKLDALRKEHGVGFNAYRIWQVWGVTPREEEHPDFFANQGDEEEEYESEAEESSIDSEEDDPSYVFSGEEESGEEELGEKESGGEEDGEDVVSVASTEPVSPTPKSARRGRRG
ncbi:hypothetical protein CC2G_011297 [Coprinopsis cinerea AmutBmut pab1-1]|nr:hypothetical protein CC2G_011297 [Coprinopsis cinerea AmutBmut pab1-1]